MKIEAILFDCDGLMFDSERTAQKMYTNTAAKYGVRLPDDLFMKITGAAVTPDLFEIPGLRPVLEEMKTKRMDLDFWSSFEVDSLNKEGLLPLWKYLKDNGFLTAVCSSSPRDYVLTLLNTVSVPIGYDVIVCGDMVSRKKPDPEIFLKAAELLGVSPAGCLVLEDSKNGILAAGRAGMRSCFIPDTIEPDEEMRQAIDLSRENLGQVIDLLKEMSVMNDAI